MRPTAFVSVAALACSVTTAITGCGSAPRSRSAGPIATLAVRPVAWNAASAPLGKVTGLAESGDIVCVFADDGASIFSAGAVVARDGTAKGWTAGDSIYATDGATRWLIGIDRVGHVQRLRAMSTFEDVTARYQLASKRVRSATVVGPGRVAFLLGDEIALSDASRISILSGSAYTMLAGGGGFGAGITEDGVDLVNATNTLVTHFALPGATWAALDPRGRLYAATRRAVYAADASGTLALVFDAGNDGIHGLVASGDRVWFADRSELGIVDGDHVALTSGANVRSDAKLQPSPSGDVWVMGAGTLQRFAIAADAMAAARPAQQATQATHPGHPSPWSATIGPVFARSCAACHQPNGVSGTDLSTEVAWDMKAPLIRERVVVGRTMPPQGHPLSDGDRAVILQWIDGDRDLPAVP
jgi:mono/diheme cytochrome c family protein